MRHRQGNGPQSLHGLARFLSTETGDVKRLQGVSLPNCDFDSVSIESVSTITAEALKSWQLSL